MASPVSSPSMPHGLETKSPQVLRCGMSSADLRVVDAGRSVGGSRALGASGGQDRVDTSLRGKVAEHRRAERLPETRWQRPRIRPRWPSARGEASDGRRRWKVVGGCTRAAGVHGRTGPSRGNRRQVFGPRAESPAGSRSIRRRIRSGRAVRPGPVSKCRRSACGVWQVATVASEEEVAREVVTRGLTGRERDEHFDALLDRRGGVVAAPGGCGVDAQAGGS